MGSYNHSYLHPFLGQRVTFSVAAKGGKIKFLEVSILARSKSRSSLIAKIRTAKLEAVLSHCVSPKLLLRWQTRCKYFSLHWCRFTVIVANSCYCHLAKVPTYLHLKEASVYAQFIVVLFALHCLLRLTSSAQREYSGEYDPLGSASCTTDCMVAACSSKLL